MKGLSSVDSTANVIGHFEKVSQIVQNKLGMRTELIEAFEIYNKLIEVNHRLKESENLLKTNIEDIKQYSRSNEYRT